jgi:hypothetical protein
MTFFVGPMQTFLILSKRGGGNRGSKHFLLSSVRGKTLWIIQFEKSIKNWRWLSIFPKSVADVIRNRRLDIMKGVEGNKQWKRMRITRKG